MPCKQQFYSFLIDTKVTDKKYEHVINVWEKFEMETMNNYHDLGLKCDMLLLANVFGKIRNNSLDYVQGII